MSLPSLVTVPPAESCDVTMPVLDAFDDGISEVASVGDYACPLARLQELEDVMFYVSHRRYQEQISRRAVTADLWALYMVLRHADAGRRWPRAAFRGVAAFLDSRVYEEQCKETLLPEESPLDTLRSIFRTSLAGRA